MHVQQTFETHPWTATTASDGRRVALNGAALVYPVADAAQSASPGHDNAPDGAPAAAAGGGANAGATATAAAARPRPTMFVRVAPPPLHEWGLSTHAAFPPAFKAAARALLLCHARAAAEAKRPQQGGEPGTTLGSLPACLVLEVLARAAPAVPRWRAFDRTSRAA